jgi:hypothetical protein
MSLKRFISLGIISSIALGVVVSGKALANPTDSMNVIYPGLNSVQLVAQTGAIASGTFTAGEAPTTGTAQIVTQNGHRYLEFDAAFSTTDQAPDLHVLLDTTSTPPSSYTSFGSYLNLGSLQSVSGTQRYPIPDSIDLADYESVVIWCRMANATIGYAPLN